VTMGAAASRLKAKTGTTANRVSAEDIIIGNDLLELVSSAMYVDPMSIFREYVQNAADAIEQARRTGTLDQDAPGKVDIEIDGKTRSVRIRDNGVGLSGEAFVKRLTALGASAKRGTDARGFRGVGRLAGLAYAQDLLFRSRSTKGEPVRELCWDGRTLKALMRETDGPNDIRALIERIVTVQEIAAENYPEHFFEVELRGIVRLRGDPLLNPNAIADYLAQVAPLPFSPAFTHGAAITAKLAEHVMQAPLALSVSGIEGQVYRPHRDTIANGNKTPLTVHEVSFIELPDIDSAVGAVGWFLHHDYEGALATATLQKGFRLRAGDIQVGGDALLEQEFPESRFNSWTVGELHVIDRRIVPNGRRDHFEQNAHFANLVNHLGPHFRDIAHRCRTSSVQRKAQRDLELALEATCGSLDLLRQNSVTPAARTRLVREIEGQIGKAEQLAAASETTVPLGDKVADVRAALSELADADSADPLAHLKPKERSQYQHFFELIYECSQNRVAAKALVDRIIARISE